jgi:hypothetical protein
MIDADVLHSSQKSVEVAPNLTHASAIVNTRIMHIANTLLVTAFVMLAKLGGNVLVH